MNKRAGAVPTITQIVKDRVTQVAAKYWAPFSTEHQPFDPNVVAEIYSYELLQSNFSTRRIMLLEFSQYLECFLWPNYEASTSSLEHVLSIVVMVNEKFRERVPAWDIFKKLPDQFPGFFKRAMEAALMTQKELSILEQNSLTIFLTNCVNSVEIDIVRSQLQKLIGFPIWENLSDGHRQLLFKNNTRLRKIWNVLQKNDAKLTPEQLNDARYERQFLCRLLRKFLFVVNHVPIEGDIDPDKVKYCERFLEFLIDIESLLPTRRFFNTLLDSLHVISKCKLSPLLNRAESEGKLFAQLLDILEFYARFEIDDNSGEPLSDADVTTLHYANMDALQKAAFKNYKNELRDFYLANVASLDTKRTIMKHFGNLSKEQLYHIAETMCLLPALSEQPNALEEYSTELLLEILIYRHEKRLRQLEILNEMPLYPTEEIIWDKNVVPTEYYNGEGCLALNKLNLQFLTIYDYLLRNFRLFRLESTYEVRQDIEDVLFRLKPWRHEQSEKDIVFGGWARMALPITSFTIVEVLKPNIGERSPASVRADITITLNTRLDIKKEWESLRKHDVCFLVTARPESLAGTKYDVRKPFTEQIQVAYIRGCEIEGMIGPDGKVIEEWAHDKKPMMTGNVRTFRVWLDCNQYRLDMEKTVKGGEDVYESFNVIIRRKPKENNFKAVLDTIRQLMNTSCVVPEFLHDILLGYGDPGAAHYSNMPNTIPTVDFNDTFLDFEHLKESFAGYSIEVKNPVVVKPEPPFKIYFEEMDMQSRKRKINEINEEKESVAKKSIIVESYKTPLRGPYPYLQPKKNGIRFTRAQIEAVKSGMQPGLTMVVGPPGTGKTDVAVQIISNLYHNWPEQRTLIITHSNQALNQLFEKIMQLDIDERHLLRLGYGEEALETEKDFSRYGRVNYALAKRLELLKEVERLQSSLNVTGDVAYTCETAGHFYLYQVYARWETFLNKVKQLRTKSKESVTPLPAEFVESNFPFGQFFANAPQPLFKKETFDQNWEIAQGCWRHLSRIFKELDEFRAFELLRSGRDRTEYLLVKEAKIIAMTCTHAALRRKDLVALGFRYDNVLMEESAQILEIETFIPLLLQDPQDGRNRLKRWIMIGDHHQLPPVIKNMAFQKYCNMEQSLFTRLVRLGVPTVDLDMQGRARPTIASLYTWRYKSLTSLPHVEMRSDYKAANAGFVFDYQFINVNDYNGVGESAPSPYFYQNLAEAEYAVAIFMYMRLLGYPAEKITIITTYNGQKHLIRDIVQRRCASNVLMGEPKKITTVDKYQGQQNDFIILSLVRTSTVGHIRDVRRLVVALSRARLGLYILGRLALFKNCFELTPAFNILAKRPNKLMILPNEPWPSQRFLRDTNFPMDPMEIEDMSHMAKFVYEFYKANEPALMSMYAQMQTPPAMEEPYKQGGSVKDSAALSVEKAQKETGSRVEKDIEFEVLMDEAAPETITVPAES